MVLSPHKPLEHKVLMFSNSIKRIFEREGKTLYGHELTTTGKRIVDYTSPILFRELLKTFPDLKYKQYYGIYGGKERAELERIIRLNLNPDQILELRQELFRLLMYIKSVVVKARAYRSEGKIPSDVISNSLIQVYTNLEGLWDIIE